RSRTMSATATVSGPLDLKLEVVVLGVSDVDRAKAFYERLGCRVAADFAIGADFRVVQAKPQNSPASIIFGKGITSPRPGPANLLHETSERRGPYEKTHAPHHWWDWYAPYLNARQNGSSPEEAAAAADRSMQEKS